MKNGCAEKKERAVAIPLFKFTERLDVRWEPETAAIGVMRSMLLCAPNAVSFSDG